MQDDLKPVSLDELRSRCETTLAAMRQAGLDVALVTIPDDIYFLSGYYTRAMTSLTALVLSLSGDAVLVTRQADEGNYLRIQDRSTITRLITFDDDQMATSMDIIGGLARSVANNGRRFGLQPEGIFTPPSQFAKLEAALSGMEIADLGDIISRQRQTKSKWELDCHRSAARITVIAMNAGVAAVQPGTLDSDVAAEVAAVTIRAGSEWGATWPIILTGAQTGRSHSSWKGDRIEPGSPTTLEFSAVRHRYHSPLYRTVVFDPSDEHVTGAEAVKAAHQACLDQMRPGTPAEAVWHAKRDAMARLGVADLSKGRAGYTVGIGFPPNWVQRNAVDLMKGNLTPLEPGMVFHVVTTMGRKNVYGIAHSSTVVITPTGHEVLTLDGLDGPVLR